MSARVSTNGRVQRARAVDSTQVKTPDRGLRLQPIGMPYGSGSARTHGTRV